MARLLLTPEFSGGWDDLTELQGVIKCFDGLVTGLSDANTRRHMWKNVPGEFSDGTVGLFRTLSISSNLKIKCNQLWTDKFSSFPIKLPMTFHTLETCS